MTNALEFFVTNQGKRVTKLYDDINKIYGSTLSATTFHSRLSASVFRRIVETKSRGHNPDVSKAVAVCLQHGDGTALKFYRLPDADEAIRRQDNIKLVDSTALFEAAVMKK